MRSGPVAWRLRFAGERAPLRSPVPLRRPSVVELMPYRICKSFIVENGHLLSKHPGKCRFPHGHSRRIEVTVEADSLDENDMVCDFKRLKLLIQDYIEQFDHALCINTADPHFAFYRDTYERVVPFDGVDPTTELMAQRVFERVAEALKLEFKELRRLRVRSVRIHETETSWAEYCE